MWGREEVSQPTVDIKLGKGIFSKSDLHQSLFAAASYDQTIVIKEHSEEIL